MSKPSKFKAVFENRQEEEPVASEHDGRDATTAPIEVVAATPTQSEGKLAVDNVAASSSEAVQTPLAKKMGRPSGKRSDPKFTQVTAYIQSQTYRDVKVALLMGQEPQEFSELIEDLLSQWLSTQKSK